jgi:hypothetical protein
MVFAVQCPKCKKFMLVEEHDQGKVVTCLLCRATIRVGNAPAAPTSSKTTQPPRR